MSPNPLDNEELYDSIVLAGVSSPGKVTLSGHDRVTGWDIKKGSGQKGATTTRSSSDPVKFTASFYLVRDDAQGIDDFADWDAFEALINSTVAGPTPKALDIYHPDLVSRQINSIVLDTFAGVVHDGKGGQTIAVKFLEYKPPQKSGGSPVGSATKTGTAPDPNAAALAELKDLTDQYQKTPWGAPTAKPPG